MRTHIQQYADLNVQMEGDMMSKEEAVALDTASLRFTAQRRIRLGGLPRQPQPPLAASTTSGFAASGLARKREVSQDDHPRMPCVRVELVEAVEATQQRFVPPYAERAESSFNGSRPLSIRGIGGLLEHLSVVLGVS
jgi:hypothetical protein